MTDLIRKSTSSLLQLSAGLVQCTGWPALICLLKAERDFEKRLDKLLAGFDFADRQFEIANKACHIVSIVLVEQCELEMKLVCPTSYLDIAANISIKHRAGVLIVHQRDKILLTQQKAGGSAVIDVESSQGYEMRLRRDELDKGAVRKVCHGDDLLSNIPIAKKKAPRTEFAKPQKELRIS